MNRDKAPVDSSEVDAVPHAMRIASLAACAFALAVVLSPVAGTAMAASGLCLLLFSFTVRGESVARILPDFWLAAAVIAVALVAILIPYSLAGTPARWMSAALPSVVLILGAWALFTRSDSRHSCVAAAAVIIVGLVTGALLIRAADDAGIDVVLLHQDGASALARGQDIYGPAVTVPNGAPGLPPGSMIAGYPYPPVVAVAYAAGMWLLGDPRWTNLLAWAVLAACAVALFMCRERRALPFLTIAAIPSWATMLQSGWTEMLSAAAIALAAVSWRHTSASGIALGLALGSKQYFAIALPLILLHKDGWRRRAPVTLATAAATLAPAFLHAPADAWRAMILSHAHAQQAA